MPHFSKSRNNICIAQRKRCEVSVASAGGVQCGIGGGEHVGMAGLEQGWHADGFCG